MAQHNDFGVFAEEKAKEFLLDNGYKILHTNYRARKAEIDIIAEHNNELIIVEVKALSNDAFRTPEEAVNKAKIKLLIQAADTYIQENNITLNVRFDIISILKVKNEWKIQHIINAFDIIN